MSICFITVCSTGVGRALAEAALRRGHDVVVTARDVEAVQDLADAFPESAMPLALDVTDPDRVVGAVAAAEARFGGIDVLVNNAGYGYRGAVEEGEPWAVQQLFDTHVSGAARTMRAVAPGMRVRRSGTIVNISSIGAVFAPRDPATTPRPRRPRSPDPVAPQGGGAAGGHCDGRGTRTLPYGLRRSLSNPSRHRNLGLCRARRAATQGERRRPWDPAR